MKDGSREVVRVRKPNLVVRVLHRVAGMIVSRLERLRPRRELADLDIPEFHEGDLLCHPKGRTLIVVSVHPPNHLSRAAGQFMTEYTVLCPEGTYDRINGAALASWIVVQKPTQL